MERDGLTGFGLVKEPRNGQGHEDNWVCGWVICIDKRADRDDENHWFLIRWEGRKRKNERSKRTEPAPEVEFARDLIGEFVPDGNEMRNKKVFLRCVLKQPCLSVLLLLSFSFLLLLSEIKIDTNPIQESPFPLLLYVKPPRGSLEGCPVTENPYCQQVRLEKCANFELFH